MLFVFDEKIYQSANLFYFKDKVPGEGKLITVTSRNDGL